MKNYLLHFAAAVTGALAIVSCGSESPDEKETDVKMNINVTVAEVTSESAAVTVSHDGDAKLTWFGFVTEDVETPLATLVDEKKDGITASDLQVGNSKTVALDGLTPGTAYRYVAFGVNAQKKTYGKPGEVSFTTGVNVIFSIGEPAVNRNSASAVVTYDQEGSFPWIDIVTTDLTTPVESIVRNAGRTIEDDAIHTESNVTLSYDGLEFETDYRIIVTGWKDGAAYGNVATAAFKTGEKWFASTDITLKSHGKIFYDPTTPGAHEWRSIIETAGMEEDAVYALVQVSKKEFDAYGIGTVIENDHEEAIADATEANPLTDNSFWVGAGGYYRPYYGPGDYVEILYMLDKENGYAPTGEYATLDVTFTEGTTSAGYEAMLGTWMVGEQEWTVEKYSAGELYAISGLFGQENLYLLGHFNPNTLALEINSQVVDYFTHQTYGLCGIYFCGWYKYNDKEYVYYEKEGLRVVSLVDNGDGTATLTPSAAGSLGSNFISLGFFWNIEEGENKGRGNYYPNGTAPLSLPATATRPAETGSDAYNKWFGKWDIIGRNHTDTADSTFFTLNVAQNTADVSYNVTSDWGIFQQSNLPLKMGFDTEKGAFVFKAGTIVSNVRVFSDYNGTFDIAFSGLYNYNNITYYDDSDGQNLAYATFGEGDKVSVTAAEIVEGVPFVGINIIAANDEDAYSMLDAPLAIPFKMERATEAEPLASRKAFSRRDSRRNASRLQVSPAKKASSLPRNMRDNSLLKIEKSNISF